jgi:hypothetical protein
VERCPNCQSPLAAQVILCTHCGFNRKTRTMVTGVSGQPSIVGKPRVRRFGAIGAGLAVILIVAVGTWFVFGRSSEAPSVKQEGTASASISSKPAAPQTKASADVREAASKVGDDKQAQITRAREALKNKTATPEQKRTLMGPLRAEALTPLGVMEFPKSLFALALSADGKTLAAACGDHSVRLFDFATQKEIKNLQGHSSPVMDVCFSADGKYLLSGSWDGSVVLWNWESGAIEHTFKSPASVMRCAMLPDGKHAVVDRIMAMEFWDLEREKLIGRGMVDADVHALSVSPKGLVATGDNQGEVTIWDPTTAKPVAHRTFGFIAPNVYFAGEETLLVSYAPDNGAVWHWKRDDVQVLDFENKDGALGDDGKALSRAEIRQALNRTSVSCVIGFQTELFDPAGKFDLYMQGSMMDDQGPVTNKPRTLEFLDAQKIKDFRENYGSNSIDLKSIFLR